MRAARTSRIPLFTDPDGDKGPVCDRCTLRACVCVRQVRAWYAKFRKPVMVSEFGADAVAGVHSNPPIAFSEEFQADYLGAHFAAFDRLRTSSAFIGEHVWNFADFMTTQGVTRVVGNRKGIFTRDRSPKLAAHTVRSRFLALANATQRWPVALAAYAALSGLPQVNYTYMHTRRRLPHLLLPFACLATFAGILRCHPSRRPPCSRRPSRHTARRQGTRRRTLARRGAHNHTCHHGRPTLRPLPCGRRSHDTGRRFRVAVSSDTPRHSLRRPHVPSAWTRYSPDASLSPSLILPWL